MQHRNLGLSDLCVSNIGMGCVTFGREVDPQSSMSIMDHAFERGITLYDTAEAYAGGESERVVGEWMQTRKTRDRIVLATKINGTLTRQRIIASAEASLQRLRTDRIDLLQTHVWDELTPFAETLEALSSLVKDGKVRHVGCSNYSGVQLSRALNLSRTAGLSRMVSVQPPYNLVQRGIETDLLPICKAENIGVISYSPLAAGFLTGKYRPDAAIPSGTRFDVIPGHQDIYFTEHGYRVLTQLDEEVAATNRSHVELALSWVLSQPGITSVLIGVRNKQQIDQAFESLNRVN